MQYFIEIKNNIITGKGENKKDVELNEGQVEVSEEFFNLIILPSSFELDEDGNIINLQPLPRPDPSVVDEVIDDEKIAMAEAIIDLNIRIEELENRLNGGV